MVEPLTDEFDLVDIALAAVSLIEGAGAQDADEVELSSPPLVAGPPARGARPGQPPARTRAARSGRPRRTRTDRGPSTDRPGSGGPWVRLFVGGGRRAGIRPGDLVGAITNEAGVPGSVVGAIQINDAFSLVDVQASVADDVGHALAGATIRGRRLQVRRDR